MAKLNIPLLKRLRTRFLRMRHPEHFNMLAISAQTECGTAMCIAGHTLDLAGYKRRLKPLGCFDAGAKGDPIWIGRNDFKFISPLGATVKNPLAAARRELGLGRITARKLFHDFDLKNPKQAAARIQELIDSAEVTQ